jgi:hypothetical protein
MKFKNNLLVVCAFIISFMIILCVIMYQSVIKENESFLVKNLSRNILQKSALDYTVNFPTIDFNKYSVLILLNYRNCNYEICKQYDNIIKILNRPIMSKSNKRVIFAKINIDNVRSKPFLQKYLVNYDTLIPDILSKKSLIFLYLYNYNNNPSLLLIETNGTIDKEIKKTITKPDKTLFTYNMTNNFNDVIKNLMI